MKYKDLQKKVDALGEKYRASDSVKEREKLSMQIREATVQLQDFLASGAKPCPDGADHRIIGMLKRPAYYDGRLELDVPAQWECGCIVCDPVLVERGDPKKVVRWSHGAYGGTPEEAVKNWNAGKWREDAQIDRVPSKDIFK